MTEMESNDHGQYVKPLYIYELTSMNADFLQLPPAERARTGFTVKIVDRRRRSGFLVEHGGLDHSEAIELAAVYLALGYMLEQIIVDEDLEKAA
jgi:hypothetical protein